MNPCLIKLELSEDDWCKPSQFLVYGTQPWLSCLWTRCKRFKWGRITGIKLRNVKEIALFLPQNNYKPIQI